MPSKQQRTLRTPSESAYMRRITELIRQEIDEIFGPLERKIEDLEMARRSAGQVARRL
jgi:hypothetical protein